MAFSARSLSSSTWISIPLGSRVYIEGYGTFIAEDTGSAIKNSKIDIFVSTHERAEELGVQYANVYLLG